MSILKTIKQMKYEIVFGSITLWGIYGGVRGCNYYNKKHKLDVIKFENDQKSYPTIYTENKRPHYYYSTRMMYGVAGVFHYITPPWCILSIINEAYRGETYLRNMESAKNKQSYYNPFYPVHYRSE